MHPSRTGPPLAPGFAIHCSLMATAVLCTLVVGCSSGPSPAVISARQLLASRQPQRAVDALAKETSAEAYYLKGIGLTRLNLSALAIDSLSKAVKLNGSEPRYIYYKKLVEDPKAIPDDVIKAFDADRSNGTLALFSAMTMARKGNVSGAIEGLKMAVALSEGAPEFLEDMYDFCVKSELVSEARSLLDKLEKFTPNDPELKKRRIVLLTMEQKWDDARNLALQIFNDEGRSLAGAETYAQILALGPLTKFADQALADLVRKFPESDEIPMAYGTALAKAQRLPETIALFDRLIAREKNALKKKVWINQSIIFPIELRDAETATNQLNRHRDAVEEGLTALYEGRILLLQGKLDAARDKFLIVIELGKQQSQGGTPLAMEGIGWVREIDLLKERQKQLQEAADQKRDQPATPAASDESS